MATYYIIAGIIAALSAGGALLFRAYRRSIEKNGVLVAQNKEKAGENAIITKQNNNLVDHGVPDAADKLQDGKF